MNIESATGPGKTQLVCALAQQTCRQGKSVLCWCVPGSSKNYLSLTVRAAIQVPKDPLQSLPKRARRLRVTAWSAQPPDLLESR